jgi:CBS domain-containing protein
MWLTPLATASRSMARAPAWSLGGPNTPRQALPLPAVEHGALLGIVSIGDVVKARITQQEHEVDTLKAYVAGV